MSREPSVERPAPQYGVTDVTGGGVGGPSKDDPWPPQPGTYYRYEDPSGHVTIVDSPSKLPPAVRQKAERIELPGGPEALQGSGSELIASERSARLGFSERLCAMPIDGASFGLGLGAGLVVTTALLLVLGRGTGTLARWVLRGALGLGVALLVLAGYLGMVRRSAGLAGSSLASPIQLVDDARKVVDQVRQQRALQEQQLKELEESSK